MKISSRPCHAMLLGAMLMAGSARNALAQSDSSTGSSRISFLAAWRSGATRSAEPRSTGSYWQGLAFGFGVSLFAHETAHIVSSMAMGFHPHVGLDQGRPTIFSGIDSQRYPHKQFIFSAAGLTTQAIINEAILDVPHSRGGTIERGILAGGIATTLFYITVGRNGSVSDISFMARTSSLSKTQLSLIFGGVSAIHALRIARNPSYDHFFVRPTENGLTVGLRY